MSTLPVEADRTMISDETVVRARTDRNAFAALYERYYPRVLRYCVRRLFVRGVAEDVVGDVFVQIAGHLPAFAGRTETDFRRWLFRIASNAVNAHLRQTLRRQQLWDAAASGRRLASTRGEESPGQPIDLLDWPAVYQAILELEPRDQTILTLRYYADLSFDEIAGVVGATAGAVRTALSRCLERLRARFDVQPGENALPQGQP